ncbi:MAG: hypothetical protein FWD66_11270 [Paludibacter sp.]|nr:hypothetical protein [Paludibacter sp.]
MRQIFFLFIFVLIELTEIYAQDVSIEFSIEWKNKIDFPFSELQGRDVKPAYLHITYRNLSSEPLFFMRVSSGHAGFPLLPYVAMDNYGRMLTPYELFTKYRNYSKDNYIVEISQTAVTFTHGWSLEYDTTNVYEPHEMPYANQNLAYIYNYITKQYYPDVPYPHKYRADGMIQDSHNPQDITKDSIKGNSHDEFIYMEPGEVYIDTYNLIGFQLIGGNFTFELITKKSEDYIYLETPLEEVKKTRRMRTMKLPDYVGKYKLFTGEFLTNKLTVYFPGIRLKE